MTEEIEIDRPPAGTGCELCIAPCPVDCITLVPRASVPHAPAPSAQENRERYTAHGARLEAHEAQRAALLTARKRGSGLADTRNT